MFLLPESMMAADVVRTMPHDLEAERAVLGAVLLGEKAIFAAAEVVRPEDFYLPAHRVLFARMLDLAMESKPVDAFTLRAELVRHGEEEKAGGPAYLAGLTDGLPRSLNVAHYARIVREKSTARMLIRLCAATAEKCYAGEDAPGRIVEEHEGELFRIAAREAAKGFEPSVESTARVYKQIEETARRKSEITGLETGFTELDRMTAGLHPQNLVVVAGRPGLGKTSFVLSVALHQAAVRGRSVGIFSLEMSADEVQKRNLSALAEVELHRMRTGFLSREDWAKLGRAARQLADARLYIDDSGDMTVTELRAKAERLAAERGLDLVIVDYLQLLRGSARRYENRTQEVTEISRMLKCLAKDLGVPVVAAAQLSRAVEKADRRPRLSDLRESGSIEQDADLVLMLHREGNRDEGSSVAEIDVAKQRNGAVGTVKLAFIKQFTKFSNLSQEP